MAPELSISCINLFLTTYSTAPCYLYNGTAGRHFRQDVAAMDEHLIWRCGAVLVIALAARLTWLLLNRLYFCPVAGFPGPLLAKLTFWYEGYWDIWCEGKYSWKIQELHEKYGMLASSNSSAHLHRKLHESTCRRPDADNIMGRANNKDQPGRITHPRPEVLRAVVCWCWASDEQVAVEREDVRVRLCHLPPTLRKSLEGFRL